MLAYSVSSNRQRHPYFLLSGASAAELGESKPQHRGTKHQEAAISGFRRDEFFDS